MWLEERCGDRHGSLLSATLWLVLVRYLGEMYPFTSSLALRAEILMSDSVDSIQIYRKEEVPLHFRRRGGNRCFSAASVDKMCQHSLLLYHVHHILAYLAPSRRHILTRFTLPWPLNDTRY